MQTIRYKKLVWVLYFTKCITKKWLIIIALWAPNIEDIESLRNAHILTEAWYDVFVPEYYGFCRSGGRFTPHSSLESLVDAYTVFSKWRYYQDFYTGQSIKRTYPTIHILWFSYGGWVALNLPRILPQITTIGAFYPVTNYRWLWKKYREETWEDFLEIIAKKYRHLYRLWSTSHWKKLFRQESLSAISRKNIRSLIDGNIFIAHGKNDTIIHFSHSEDFWRQAKKAGANNIQCLLYENCGHGYETMIPATLDFVKWLDTLTLAK